MENKMGRKNMLEWLETMQGVIGNLYNDAFQAGYDAAKDEVLDIDTMAQHLVDRYNDEGLSNLMMIVDKIRPRRVEEFKTVKRKAKVGERILVTNPTTTFGDYGLGSVLTVIDDAYGGAVRIKEVRDAAHIDHEEYEVIIENEGHVSVKSANQQRAELIQRAREFVDNIIGSYPNFEMDIGRFSNQAVSATFHVNAEKRTVVALVHGYFSRKLVCKGIAKCMPGDVFNVDIGKAIALARVLGIEVPQEFIHAVQPDEVVPGMVVVKHSYANIGIPQTVDYITGTSNYSGIEEPNFWTKEKSGSLVPSQVNITDDTNAQYEVTP